MDGDVVAVGHLRQEERRPREQHLGSRDVESQLLTLFLIHVVSEGWGVTMCQEMDGGSFEYVIRPRTIPNSSHQFVD